jgi:dinuclear metal center YbgI/SA1388 family protein
MKLKKLLESIDEVLPEKTAMDGDRVGLQIQGGRDDVNNFLVTLEINDEVVGEAVKENCDCIITFHPLIYSPLLQISDEDRVGRLCSKLIKHSIALVAIHTNFDAFSKGTSHKLAEKLGLDVEGFLVPVPEAKGHGMGVIAKASNPIKPEELLELINNICISPVRYTKGREDKLIDRIAIVGGSGTSFINEALKSGCDAFITADVTYHRFHQVQGRMWLIDPGHYEMEQFVPQGLKKVLIDKLDKKEYNFIKVSSILTNPVRFFPDSNDYTNKQKQYLNNNKMV